MARLLALVILSISVEASLQVNYPLNQQFPPIALVDVLYHYQFPPTTFQTDSDTVQYSLVGNPLWLSLNSRNRTLSGTPRIDDVGEIGFKIVAAGLAGAVVNMDSQLLVSKGNGPRITQNITQVLSSAGELSGPSTINIGPLKPFDISFSRDTFDSPGTSLNYQALLSDHTPLPAWIGFEPSTLRFTGTAPPVTNTQTFDIILIASEAHNFAAASLSFTAVVSNHQLLFQPYSQTLNLSKGEEIRISDLKSTLYLDGSPVQDAHIRSMNATLPPWLKFDNTTHEISGRAPSGTMSQDIEVSAIDQFGDVAQLGIHISFQSELFATEIGQLNATTGASFEYTIPPEVLVNRDEILSVDLSSLSHYLHFDTAKSTISGTIEQDVPPQKVQCSLTAVSSDGTQRDTQNFQIVVKSSTEISTSGTSTENTHSSNTDENKSGGKTAGIIIGSIIGAICGILLLVAFALCWRRRRQRMSYVSPKLPRSPKKSDISRPMFIPYGWPDVDVDHDQDLEKGKDEHDLLVERAPEKPPRLDLNLPHAQADRQSLTDSIGDADTRILDTFETSSWGLQNDITPSQHPHDSIRIPTDQLAKRASQRSETFRRHKRRTTTVYQDQIHRSSGLPVNRRITGMGHGRQAYSPSRSNTNFSRSSLRRPLSTSSYNTTARCTSAFSTAPSTLPQPPVAHKQTPRVTIPVEKRRSIRLVATSTRSSLVDRPMDEKRNSYIRQRASAASPFFSSGGNRVSSSTYRSPPAFIESNVVKPDDGVIHGRGKVLPDSTHVIKPSVSPIPETSAKEFPGSLRQNRAPRPYTSAGMHRDRIEKSYARPGTTIVSKSSGMGRRASTRDSLRSYELKSRLNDLTGSEIFKDAELSDSVYTDEEDEIAEAEKRTTVKPSQFTLPPLNIDTRRRSKRNSGEKKKSSSKRESQRELKRTSERDPTPFYSVFQAEHGGKENMSSTYTIGTKSTPVRAETHRNTEPSLSPERPKPKPVARHSRTISEARKVNRTSTPRASKTLSQPSAPKERHSRKSLHSHSRSRQSGPSKKSHSRTQSGAYPYFDFSEVEGRPSSIGNAISSPVAIDPYTRDMQARPSSSHTKASNMTRDLSGNLTFYADDEEPTVEELGSSSIGFRTSNGRINSMARRSRLASLHESSRFQSTSPPPSLPSKSSKRQTVVAGPVCSPPETSARPAGLGLFPVDARVELCVGGKGKQEEERDTPEVEDGRLEVAKGRQTWGSMKSKASRWVSGGYWDKQGKEDKVFI
ncbi:hypothetical protein DE146DRAFT_166522 [Phaeosphaeria sp. MPI-PUGE-AT-0046c]|nr:hypothetical protein DE146DRAFT_166522 [Phaeosphaeria sp. MPI-PUGE-AT-0046c]